MSEIENTINSLKALDLCKVTDAEVLKAVSQTEKLVLFGSNIKAGQFVLRGRPDRGFKPYYYEREITYIKQSESNIIPRYNRASIEGQSMFYGSIPTGDENFSQIQTCFEITSISGSDTEDGKEYEEYVTMGKWRVKKEFPVTSIVHHSMFLQVNSFMKSMNDEYLKVIEQYPAQKEEYIKAVEYLSSEFAKPVPDDKRYLYKITGAFANILFAHGLAGVIYPSVKTEGKGFNIAILPTTVDSCLVLEKVAVWRLKKKHKNFMIQPYLYCDKFSSDGKFIWEEPTAILANPLVESRLDAK